jgi:multifunctional 2-oxoglutarate metabolism enzyme
MAAQESTGSAFGANSWLVEEMYEQYRADPDSVGESWREFFEDYRSVTAAAHPQTTPSPAPAPAPTGTGTGSGSGSSGAGGPGGPGGVTGPGARCTDP